MCGRFSSPPWLFRSWVWLSDPKSLRRRGASFRNRIFGLTYNDRVIFFTTSHQNPLDSNNSPCSGSIILWRPETPDLSSSFQGFECSKYTKPYRPYKSIQHIDLLWDFFGIPVFFSGLLNHWFPLIRPYMKPLFLREGYLRGGVVGWLASFPRFFTMAWIKLTGSQWITLLCRFHFLATHTTCQTTNCTNVGNHTSPGNKKTRSIHGGGQMVVDLRYIYIYVCIPTNSNGPEFLPELENHPFPVLGRNFSTRARFPIQAKFLVLQQNSEKHPWVDFRKFGREFPGLGREFPGIGQQKTRS